MHDQNVTKPKRKRKTMGEKLQGAIEEFRRHTLAEQAWTRYETYRKCLHNWILTDRNIGPADAEWEEKHYVCTECKAVAKTVESWDTVWPPRSPQNTAISQDEKGG